MMQLKHHKSWSAVFVLTMVIAPSLQGCGNARSFDSAVWLKANSRERGRMSQNLVDSKVLVGRSLDHAKQILGQPEKDWGRVIQYQIDLGWPLKDPQHYGLQVHLDENRNVLEVRIVD